MFDSLRCEQEVLKHARHCSNFVRMLEVTNLNSLNFSYYIQSGPGGQINILGGDSIGHCAKNVRVVMCLILNGYRDRAVGISGPNCVRFCVCVCIWGVCVCMAFVCMVWGCVRCVCMVCVCVYGVCVCLYVCMVCGCLRMCVCMVCVCVWCVCVWHVGVFVCVCVWCVRLWCVRVCVCVCVCVCFVGVCVCV